MTEVVQTPLKVTWLKQNSQETTGMITTHLLQLFYITRQGRKLGLTVCDTKKIQTNHKFTGKQDLLQVSETGIQ